MHVQKVFVGVIIWSAFFNAMSFHDVEKFHLFINCKLS